jgi:deoxyribodipyrimidine photo-lyase
MKIMSHASKPASGEQLPFIVIHWFRRDLRLMDNTALNQALLSGFKVLPIFIFDSEILNSLEKDDRRVSFIYQALRLLNSELSTFNSGLKVFYGSPAQILEALTHNYNVKSVFTNTDYEPYALERDESVHKLLKNKGIGFHMFKDQVIFEKDEIVKEDGKPYTVFTPYSNKWNLRFSLGGNGFALPIQTIPSNFLDLPEHHLLPLHEIGFNETKEIFRLPVVDDELIINYDKTRNYPAISGTSQLGPHLRFGTVTIRLLVARAQKLNLVWLKELQWREFFMQILWHFPQVVSNPFKPQYGSIPWLNNEDDFRKWCAGQTGYPLVDAGMRELKETGFMHNRVRMVTASFLVKHLLVDWRWGEQWFAQNLLDFELASNNGNWQWAAGCGCDAAPYFRIFNPISQAIKFDPENKYIRKWVPEYGSSSYPAPIVEHSFARLRCLNAYAYVR